MNANLVRDRKVFWKVCIYRPFFVIGYMFFIKVYDIIVMDGDVMNNIIVITGGANGLGEELVKQSIELGFFVCNIDRDIEKMELLSEKYNNSYCGYVGDISDESFIKDTFEKISKLGEIKVLINNAGEPSFKIPTEYTKADIDVCFKGLEGMILCSTEALKIKYEQDLKIVNIMSSAALRGNKQEAVYCATKWGEKGYTESLKAAYKGTSVKVIGVYPGGINTNFYKNSRDYVSYEKQNTFMNSSDVAKIVLSNVLSDINLTVADIIIERNSN